MTYSVRGCFFYPKANAGVELQIVASIQVAATVSDLEAKWNLPP